MRKLRELSLVRRMYTKIFDTYEKYWNSFAITKRRAMSSILSGIEDEKIFNQKGEEDANELKKIIEPNSVVLDIGCGIGRIETFLAPYCKEIHGIDVSKRMIKWAKKRLKEYNNVFLYKTNGRDLSIFPDNKFDFVFSILVLQHLEKEDAYIYERDLQSSKIWRKSLFSIS